MRQLIPLLQFLNDFSEILITDDKYDIATFSSPTHPSMLHHYQWGTLIKGLTDTAIQLITFSSRMLESQESQAQSLSAIRQMMHDAESQRNADKMRRVNVLMEYFDNLRGRGNNISDSDFMRQRGDIDWNNARYMGNLNDVIVRKDFQEAVRAEYYRRQQARLVQQRSLPQTIVRPPKAPRL